MKALKRIFDRMVDAAAWISGAAALLMMVHITVDVTGRSFFNSPITGTLEIAANFYMPAIAFFPLALLTRERGQIIVELFTGWMQPRGRKLLDGIMATVTTVYMTAFTFKALQVAIDKTELREAKESGLGFIEIWPGRWFVVIGFALMLVYVIYYQVRDLHDGVTGRVDEAKPHTSIPDE